MSKFFLSLSSNCMEFNFFLILEPKYHSTVVALEDKTKFEKFASTLIFLPNQIDS